MLMGQKPPTGEQDWDAARQKAVLRELFADAGWEAPRVLDGMDGTDDFYFEALRQVRMARWSNGRVALVGDAAWCPTALGGIGATLSLVGAYALAGELSRADDVGAGFAAYERYMRPIVEKGQAVPKIMPRLMHPRTRFGIRVLHGALSVASRPGVRNFAGRFAPRDRDKPELPRFEAALG